MSALSKMHLKINTMAHLSACQGRLSQGSATWGSTDPGRAPIQVNFHVEYPLLYLNPVAKVFI